MPADTPTPDDPKGAARVGAELRQVRERLGWPLEDVAAGLRIRLPYLAAIEAGNLAALPGAAYQTGFVRSYAQALGLDADEILRRFRAEGMGVTTKAELSFLAPVPDRAVPTGAIILLGVILLLAGYGLWYRHTEHERRLAAAVPSVPTELAPLAVPKPAPAPAPIAVTKPAAAPAASAPPAPVATTPAPAPVMPAQPGIHDSAPPAAAPAAPAPPPPTTASGQTITATGDTWVQVQDPTGTILFSRVLHAGDSWPVPDLPGLTMTAGNAGNTAIADNGKPGAPLGGPGTVLRDYQLTPLALDTITKPPTPAATP